MDIPVYEIVIFVGGAIAGGLLRNLTDDLYPIIVKYAKRVASRVYYYFPHKILERRIARKRGKQKTQELIDAIQQEDLGDNED